MLLHCVCVGDGLGSGKEGDVVTVTLAGVPASTILHPAADVVSVTACEFLSSSSRIYDCASAESGCWGRGKVVVSSQALETSTTVPGVTFAYWRGIIVLRGLLRFRLRFQTFPVANPTVVPQRKVWSLRVTFTISLISQTPLSEYLAFRAKLRLKGNEYPAPFNSQLVKDIAKLLDVSTNR